jgi:hypothetical protein
MTKPALWMLAGIVAFHMVLLSYDAGKIAYGIYWR